MVFTISKNSQKDLPLVFFPPCPTWQKCYFAQIILELFILIVVLSTKRLYNILTNKNDLLSIWHWSIKPSLSMILFKPCIIIMLRFRRWCIIICNKKIGQYVYHAYVKWIHYHIKIHIHYLPKFEHKTSWRHPNAFAIKL
jgi:hypothetical protein